jgi:hypothetical protein
MATTRRLHENDQINAPTKIVPIRDRDLAAEFSGVNALAS